MTRTDEPCFDPALKARIDRLMGVLDRYLKASGWDRAALKGELKEAIEAVRTYVPTDYAEPTLSEPQRTTD